VEAESIIGGLLIGIDLPTIILGIMSIIETIGIHLYFMSFAGKDESNSRNLYLN